MKNFIPWKKMLKKLVKFQKKIHNTQDQPRLCRDLQRLLRRASWVQLYILRQILCEQKKNNKNFRHMLLLLESPQNRLYLNLQITDRLWIFVLSPFLFFNNQQTLQIKMNHQIVLTGQKSSKVYRIFEKIWKMPSIQYLIIYQLQNFLSQQNKFWILSNILIEKKYFLIWLKKALAPQQQIAQPFSNKSRDFQNFISFQQETESLSLLQENLNDLKKIFQYLSINNFLNSVLKNDFPKENFLIEYHFFLLFLTTNQNFSQKMQSLMKNDFLKKINDFGLILKFIKVYSKREGLDFLGWHFLQQSKDDHFSASISQQNIRNHQREFKKYLKKCLDPPQPVDQVIQQLNRKIQTWKNFYYPSYLAEYSEQSQQFKFQLDDYLFWKIWYWIQKRHRTKSSKWLYQRYWKKLTSNQWVFSINNIYLKRYSSKNSMIESPEDFHRSKLFQLKRSKI